MKYEYIEKFRTELTVMNFMMCGLVLLFALLGITELAVFYFVIQISFLVIYYGVHSAHMKLIKEEIAKIKFKIFVIEFFESLNKKPKT